MGKTTKPRVDKKAVEILKLNDSIKQLEDRNEQLQQQLQQFQQQCQINYDGIRTHLRKFLGHYRGSRDTWRNWYRSQEEKNKSLTRVLNQTTTRVKTLQRKIYEPMTEPPPDLFASFFGSEDLRSILSDEIALDFSDEQETNSQQKA